MIPSECQALDDELRPVILVCVLAVGLVLALVLIMTADGIDYSSGWWCGVWSTNAPQH